MDKNVTVTTTSKPFKGMNNESFKRLIELIESQYIFIIATERTIKGAIKELKKKYREHDTELARFKFCICPLMEHEIFVIVDKENTLFKSMLKQYKNKEGAWIEIT
ncbi:MAG: hypothetical protein KQ78_01980 [Candidatus Izimaplasma bacterium HR2]|nr:MAG: hypothetical protein KQ78_01980 [Candidatus Izimaplasma bacterium HR2]